MPDRPGNGEEHYHRQLRGVAKHRRGAYALFDMTVFLLIVIGLPLLNIAWWVWADSRLRPLPHARRWRLLLAAFVAGNLAIYGWLFLSRFGGTSTAVPVLLLALCYVWHLVILPATVLIVAGAGLARAALAGVRWLPHLVGARRDSNRRTDTIGDSADVSGARLSNTSTRRQFLAGAMVATPPIAAALGQVRGLAQLDSFRVRHLDVWIPTLPPALDGVTIAHVSDIHVGRFTNGSILREVVTRTNALHPDLVVFTGDLIDHALSDLRAGLDVLKRLAPGRQVFTCEGNHDLFEGRDEFERRVAAAGIPLLLNESAVTEIRGESIQILGLRWGQPGAGRGARVDQQMNRVLPLRRPAGFSILLAHHPHAFDRAAEAGIPLTLAGHTHGGQLMLSDDVGAGSLLFKYWSGLYRKGASTLVVSNGVGNWFPLRINAPAEILHLTLRVERGTAHAAKSRPPTRILGS